MSGWSEVFLGIIAAATLLMALVQVGVIVCGYLLVRRAFKLLNEIEREIRPLIATVNAVGRDAARAAALAVVQVERVDKLIGDLTVRIEDTAASLQKTILAPLRDGAAVLAGVRAALAVLKDLTSRPGKSGSRADEEDALFIG